MAMQKKEYNILHVFNDPKFSKGFFEFLNKHHYNLEKDFLFHYRCTDSTCHHFGMNKIFAKHFFSPIANLAMLRPLFHSKKIIIHSMASPFLLVYLYLFPRLIKKTFWVIWGKDLYFYKTLERKHIHHEVYEFFRRRVLRKIPHIITFLDGDYELAKEWYGSTAKLHKCFMYPSNLYQDSPTPIKDDDLTVILVGNSADPSNNHLEIFSRLESFKDENIKLITPLSYGDEKYAKIISKEGKEIFGNKFIPINSFIPPDEYLSLLSSVDIGLFAHKRQQAMGNITTLLGMGKKVYMRNDISSWGLFKTMGVNVYDINEFDIKQLSETEKSVNIEKIKAYFSEDELIKQWHEIVATEI